MLIFFVNARVHRFSFNLGIHNGQVTWLFLTILTGCLPVHWNIASKYFKARLFHFKPAIFTGRSWEIKKNSNAFAMALPDLTISFTFQLQRKIRNLVCPSTGWIGLLHTLGKPWNNKSLLMVRFPLVCFQKTLSSPEIEVFFSQIYPCLEKQFTSLIRQPFPFQASFHFSPFIILPHHPSPDGS